MKSKRQQLNRSYSLKWISLYLLLYQVPGERLHSLQSTCQFCVVLEKIGKVQKFDSQDNFGLIEFNSAVNIIYQRISIFLKVDIYIELLFSNLQVRD